MTNLFRCLTCNTNISSEIVNTHQCNPKITRYKTVDATHYFITKNEEGEDCILVNTLNGMALRIVIKEPNIVPLTEGLSCDPEHPTIFSKNKTDGDFPIPEIGFCSIHS